ncbi:Spo0E family sporulation regulatory protein-aspartic acid phosphatase [Robertmurraya sp. Marseille-Q9965]
MHLEGEVILKMENNEVMRAIEKKRQQMIGAGLEYGLTHEKTIQYSKELDQCLNLLNRSEESKKGNVGQKVEIG